MTSRTRTALLTRPFIAKHFSKILICGMSKSAKISVLGGSELNQVSATPPHFALSTSAVE